MIRFPRRWFASFRQLMVESWRRNPLATVFVSVTLVCVWSVTATAVWWLNDPSPVFIERYTFPVPVVRPDVRDKLVEKLIHRAGDMLFIYREMCVQRSGINIVLRRALRNPYMVLPLPTGEIALRRTGCYGVTGAVELPNKLPPGEYWYESTIVADVHPLRTIIVPLSSVRIVVKEDHQ